MKSHLAAPALAALLTAACSSAPKPLPGGPPPEYEPARAYDGGPDDPTAAPVAPAAPLPALPPEPEAPAAEPAEPATPAPPPAPQ